MDWMKRVTGIGMLSKLFADHGGRFLLLLLLYPMPEISVACII